MVEKVEVVGEEQDKRDIGEQSVVELKTLFSIAKIAQSWINQSGSTAVNSKSKNITSHDFICVVVCSIECTMEVFSTILSICYTRMNELEVLSSCKNLNRLYQIVKGKEIDTKIDPSRLFLIKNMMRIAKTGHPFEIIGEKVFIHSVTFNVAPIESPEAKLFVLLFQNGEVVANSLVSQKGVKKCKIGETNVVILIDCWIQGSIRFKLFDKCELGNPKTIFDFFFESSFLLTDDSFELLIEGQEIKAKSPLKNILLTISSKSEFDLEEERLRRAQIEQDELFAKSLMEPDDDTLNVQNIESDQELAMRLQREELEGLGEIEDQSDIDDSQGDLLPVSKYVKRKQGEECQICRLELVDGEQIKTLPCFHFYHRQCVDQWFRQRMACPVCLVRINES